MIPKPGLARWMVWGLLAATTLATWPAAPPAGRGPGPRAAAAADLVTADLKAQRGDMAAAETIYRQLAGQPAHRFAAVAGLADIYLMTGRHDQTRTLLETAVAQRGAPAMVWTRWGQYLQTVGLYSQAAEAFTTACTLDEQNLAARAGRAQVLLVLGRRDEALDQLRWFERFAKRGGDPGSPVNMVIAAEALDLLAVQTGRRSYYSKLILNDLLVAAERADRSCWQSRLAQGRLLASRYNEGQAAKEFRGVLDTNPKVADAHVGLAGLFLEQWNFEEVDKHITAALAINPRSVEALAMRAALKLQERRHAEALAAAEAALAVNPHHPRTLGLAAAAARLLPDTARFDQLLARARQLNPQPAETYLTLGDALVGERQFDEAQHYLAAALKTWPGHSDALIASGMALMQTGDEAKAREALETAYKADSFNVRVFNTLNLLDKLSTWAASDLVTEHFIIRHDPARDAVAARLFAELCEEIYPQLTSLFGHKPAVKTLIEILPEHQYFGVRLTGQPRIHTVGACTGNVIAMDAPTTRALASPIPFNWAQVLRHEYTHTLTLAATENRIAHWFTEGLAVWSEARQRSWNWQRLLASQLANDDLFTPQEISWGFMRPRRRDRDDRQLAYAQAEWMCHYIEHRWGRPALLAMMDGYRRRLGQPRVFAETLKLTEDEFHRDFCAWARGDVLRWGLTLPPKPRSVEELQTELLITTDAPGLSDLHVQLSRAYQAQRDPPKALDAARKALELGPTNPAALERLAELLLAQRQTADEAAALWRKLYDLDPRHWRAAEFVGQASLKARDTATARAAFERLVGLVHGHTPAWQALAMLYLESDQLDRVAEARQRLMALDETNADHARWLAEYHAEADRHERAVHYYREVLFINPYDIDAHVAIAEHAVQVTDWPPTRRDTTAQAALTNAVDVRRGQNLAQRQRGRLPDTRAEALLLMALARHHKAFGRLDDARAAATQAGQLANDVGAQEWLTQLAP